MRLFIGIFPPEEIKEKIWEIKEKIESLPWKCKFVEKENYHISLSFLGEVKEEKVKEIENKLKEISSRYPKFVVVLKNFLFIPSKSYFRVLALDITEGKNYLVKISNEIKKDIGGDIKPPHLTISRIKNVFDKNKIFEEIEKIKFRFSFEVKSISLVKSQLTRKGPIYTEVFKSELS